ncbi:hypothetical protein PHYSODRAFT_498090 [Phytophthora sojae]|uniref:Uncharacterized protein n=1 Tax=Phytophthora sojae (strain P6497) TaxID=1094619 RepID=G4ZEI2_PHYSP|nr:hypothetical protein PHYSODRAFT_498090 [Phytophthora sojae]EGZ19037.1 hypothetical protein PHYSODRAFT_498090 [Phytophthora sojae]|eukprot:XP_009528095.1 hypothetical protein PHYSODRAFT_498090 [Phytophthora sojae]
MSLAAFVPTNTQKARNTAVAAFKRMLEEEKVSLEFVEASILLDASGKRVAATMDRFGFYLATNEGKKGKLARNTCPESERLGPFQLCVGDDECLRSSTCCGRGREVVGRGPKVETRGPLPRGILEG